MQYLWLLLPIVLAVMAYKITSPAFLVDLAATAIKALLPKLLHSSPHSKEYWDVYYEAAWGPYERAQKEARLKAILAKEGKL